MHILKSAGLIVIAAAVIVCLGFIIYFALLPDPADRFSEFYILNENGKPYDYPVQVSASQPVHVTIGIINHEGKTAFYTVCIMSVGAIIKSLDTGAVNQDGKWEGKTNFTISTAGAGRQIEFYLFMDGGKTPHIKQPLVLMADVKGQ